MDPLPTEPASPPTVPGTAPGRTVIADPAAVRIAAVAARSVPGVYALGGGAGRLGALRDAVGAAEPVQGVRVEVGQTQVAVDVSLVAEYGYPLHRLADAVRATVYQAVSDLVGLEVIEVNVEVSDVHVPGLNDVRSSEKSRALGSTQL
ncbi:Asp23/Gls24 family envelope stress response protein [Arthrobacter sp. TMN-37]